MNCYSLKSLTRLALSASIALLLLGGGSAVWAQAPQPPAPQTAPQQQLLTPDQLDDLVAPIALYPDQLLSQVMVASTYPLEVVEAQQWVQHNSNLRGAQLTDAARQQPWDPSVQALVAFPDVLARLNQDVRWTTDLGNAFLAQQADVMSAVQRMRARAQANGKLSSTPQQSVTTQTQDGQSAIQIQPVDPQVVYVPYYDPAYIWGPPVYGYYPSLFYPSFGFGFWPGINIGLCFGGWGGWGFGGWGWGWGPNWFGHSVFVNGAFFNRYGYRAGFAGGFGGRGFVGRTAWAHDPGHRLGVPYATRSLSARYGAASVASRANVSRSFGAGSFNRSAGAGNSFSRAGGAGSYAGSRYQSNANRGGFQSSGRSFQGGGQSYRSTPQSSTPNANRSFGSNGARSFNSGSAPRSFSGGSTSRSFGAPRSYSGGGYSAPRSFSGGSAPRSSGGGSSHSFAAPRSSGGGGGGGHSFGGGGGGGHSSGGGHHR